ncbi:MAG: ATPase, T2SS/T4P/T4SS family, partial [Heyndrickxia sp.]
LSDKQAFSFDRMSLFPNSAKKLMSLLTHSHGLLLFTGPTGSGKSTTMYTLVEKCANKDMRNVITLEDPVEIKNELFLQVQVNEKAGITYSNGLKAILRHDPDIIIVGEIRDHETAEIAVRAALTGHLVLSTLNTTAAKGAIYRLLEFGIKQSEMEQTLIGIAAQRLVTLHCPFCGEQCSKYCPRYHEKRRAAVYELLYGKSLKHVLEEVSGEEISYQYVTLRETLRKGIALGYISKQEYDRWVFEAEEANLERAGYISK